MTTTPLSSYPGAQWWKFDFHCHTPASTDTAWYPLKGEDALKPEAWLKKHMEAEIDCVAITDHNSGAWIDRLKEALARLRDDFEPGFRELHLFPGVELSINGGIHLLALFDPAKKASHIDELLGAVGYRGTKGDSDSVTELSMSEVVKKVNDLGGIAIPAHVDRAKGLLELKSSTGLALKHDSNTIRAVLQLPGIVAMEQCSKDSQHPAVYSEVSPRWTEVVGSDCHSFQGRKAPGSRFTWVKMESPSIEGLRLALHDGAGVSVVRDDQVQAREFVPNAVPSHLLEWIEVDKARHFACSKPEKIPLRPGLTTIVGGRGTGKSSLVHFIRLASARGGLLQFLKEGHEARDTFSNFAKVPKVSETVGALQADTTIRLWVLRHGVQHLVSWSSKTQKPLVQVREGDEWKDSEDQDVARFPLHILSQGQLVGLASEGHGSLMSLVDLAAGVSDIQKELEQLAREHSKQCAELREQKGLTKERPALLTRLEDTSRKIEAIEKSGNRGLLKRYQTAGVEQEAIDIFFGEFQKLSASLSSHSDEAAPKVPEFLSTESDAQELLSELLDRFKASQVQVRGIVQALSTALVRVRERLPATSWGVAALAARNDYGRLVEEGDGALDPIEYDRLVTAKKRTQEELSKLERSVAQQDEIQKAIDETRAAYLEKRREVSRRRSEFLSDQIDDNRFVRLQVVEYGASEADVEASLRDCLHIPGNRFEKDVFRPAEEDGKPATGLVGRLLAKMERSKRLELFEGRLDGLRKEVELFSDGQGDCSANFRKYLEKLGQSTPEYLDKLFLWYPADALRVKYSPRGDGKGFRPIEQASAGQRSAAILAFLLAHGDHPIILDQPEDDLDNALIYDLVVRQLRQQKQHRQIIVVTHNPNIVVNADADLIHVLNSNGKECRVELSGCLQRTAIRTKVCEIMEGGREAFLKRYDRLVVGETT